MFVVVMVVFAENDFMSCEKDLDILKQKLNKPTEWKFSKDPDEFKEKFFACLQQHNFEVFFIKEYTESVKTCEWVYRLLKNSNLPLADTVTQIDQISKSKKAHLENAAEIRNLLGKKNKKHKIQGFQKRDWHTNCRYDCRGSSQLFAKGL